MADTNPDLEAQAVDEALRHDQMKALWKAYGKYVIGGAIGIVLAVGGSQLYEYQVNAGKEANSAVFSKAVDQAVAEGADPAEIWEQAASEVTGGYSALAGLRLATELAKAGDVDAALSAYDTLAADAGNDIVLREYAQLLAAMLVLDKKNDLAEARSRFSVLSVKGQPWYFTATEQLAFINMKEGALEQALEQFAVLADDADTPQSVAARARQFRNMLEGQGVGMLVPEEMSAEEAVPTEAEPAEEVGADTGNSEEAEANSGGKQ